MMRLHQIQEAVHSRVNEITTAQTNWPCRRGCDDCCRHLASVPVVNAEEWRSIAAAMDQLPGEIAVGIRSRIRNSAFAERPVTCPLLDSASGACLVYEARPVACRAYGFYAEREFVLGCFRIEAIAEETPDVIWGNHSALEQDLRELGPATPLHEWLGVYAVQHGGDHAA